MPRLHDSMGSYCHRPTSEEIIDHKSEKSGGLISTLFWSAVNFFGHMFKPQVR